MRAPFLSLLALFACGPDVEVTSATISDSNSGSAEDSAEGGACDGVTHVCHLASVNGTEHFYTHPDLVLDVGVRGMINVVDAAGAKGVRNLFLASSSEVYQSPQTIPTGESVPMQIPDVLTVCCSPSARRHVVTVIAGVTLSMRTQSPFSRLRRKAARLSTVV
jgi:nucleoside-diphosphate-sugar epimerase